MPLSKGKSKESFSKNVSTEMNSGKSQKQSLAIAYALKRKAMQKKAEGGMSEPMDDMDSEDMVSKIMQKRKYAMGGMVSNEPGKKADEMSADYDYLSSGDLDDSSTNSGESDGDFLGNEKLDHDDHDMVSMIMKKRKQQRNPSPA